MSADTIKIVSDVSVPANELWAVETLGYRVERAPAGIRIVVERCIVGKIIGLGVGLRESPE